MKVNSLIAVISNFEKVVATVGGSERSSDLKDLRGLFVGHEEANVGSFINRLIKHRAVHRQDNSSPPIVRLETLLSGLEALLRSADGKKAAEDVSKLVKLLEGSQHASIIHFVSEARGSLVEPAKTKVGSAKAPRKKAGPEPEMIPPSDYATALREASRDNVKFDTLVEQLRADRKIKKQEMREIAQLYLGYEIAKKKGRADALADIVDRQAVDSRQDARGSMLDRLKPW
jgi:hypothetical protein